MGCDIHMVLERKTKAGQWYGWQRMSYLSEEALDYTYAYKEDQSGAPEAPPRRPSYVGFIIDRRNYRFFNALCGVRGDGSEFGYECRGLPSDASAMSQEELSEEDADLHSHSWLTVRELLPALAAHWGKKDKKPEEYVFERMADPDGNLYLAVELLDDRIGPLNVDEWRVVFAFDN
jgi:hypothetical protein